MQRFTVTAVNMVAIVITLYNSHQIFYLYTTY